jgi:hypothetical protein
MHWSKMRELLAATNAIYSELKNLCVWCKPNGGMESFYRSRHKTRVRSRACSRYTDVDWTLSILPIDCVARLRYNRASRWMGA